MYRCAMVYMITGELCMVALCVCVCVLLGLLFITIAQRGRDGGHECIDVSWYT